MIRVNVMKQLNGHAGTFNVEVDFNVEQGSFVTLFGPSGTGKSSILRMIAGLLTPDEGVIEVNGKVWFDSSQKINILAHERHIGFVFQEYSLFPHMTVRQNLEFASSTPDGASKINALLDVTGLGALQHQRPVQLSGGQKQRVALIRALLRQAPLYLLDEPLAAVDAAMRVHLQDAIMSLYRDAYATTLFVSHDMAEVFKLASNVIVLEEGKIVRQGNVRDIFEGSHISGKFKFPGEIIAIDPDQGVYIVSVLVGNNLVKVVATPAEIAGLSIGSKIIVASKAFNPILLKL